MECSQRSRIFHSHNGFTGCLAGCIISNETEGAHSKMHHRFWDPGCKGHFPYGDIISYSLFLIHYSISVPAMQKPAQFQLIWAMVTHYSESVVIEDS